MGGGTGARAALAANAPASAADAPAVGTAEDALI